MNRTTPALASALALALAPAGPLPASASASAAEPASLTVAVTGIRNTHGALLACVFKEPAGFPTCQKSPSAIRQRLKISGSAMSVRFPDLAPGTYAVTVQHDEDGDGKLKTNFIGIPQEGVGISNNPGGIPRWNKAVITLSGARTIAITMRYL